MPKLIIADDHPIIRTGIKYLLKNYFNDIDIYEAENGSQVIDIIKKPYPAIDMVLMDLNMPSTDSQRTLQTILALSPNTYVLIMSMNKEEIFGPLYIKLGARGYIFKDTGEWEMLKAVDCVLRGDIYIRKEMKHFYDGYNNINNPYQLLSVKEMEILRHLVQGRSVTQICGIMNISITTVSTHKSRILSKLGMNNIMDLKSLTDLYPL